METVKHWQALHSEVLRVINIITVLEISHVFTFGSQASAFVFNTFIELAWRCLSACMEIS